MFYFSSGNFIEYCCEQHIQYYTRNETTKKFKTKLIKTNKIKPDSEVTLVPSRGFWTLGNGTPKDNERISWETLNCWKKNVQHAFID